MLCLRHKGDGASAVVGLPGCALIFFLGGGSTPALPAFRYYHLVRTLSFSEHLPCCDYRAASLIFFRTYPAVQLACCAFNFFFALNYLAVPLSRFSLTTYPAVRLFFCALTLLYV